MKIFLYVLSAASALFGTFLTVFVAMVEGNMWWTHYVVFGTAFVVTFALFWLARAW